MVKRVIISIPQTCHEKWEDMSVTEKGGYCKACQKCVVDFTRKTDSEVYDYVAKGHGEMCGRFTAGQLDRVILKSRVNRSFFNWKAIAAGFAALFTTAKIFAGPDSGQKPVTEHKLDESYLKKLKPDEAPTDAEKRECRVDNVVDTITVTIRMFNKNTHKALPFAEVIASPVYGRNYADSLGVVKLQLPSNSTEGMYIYSSGYEGITIGLNELKGNKVHDVFLAPEMEHMLMGVMRIRE